MKKSFMLIATVMMAFMLSGCVKLYKDVQTEQYATLQMVTKGESFWWNDSYTVNIYDYSQGCQNMLELGLVGAQGAGPTDVVKIPVETPLLLKIKYSINKGANLYVDYINVVLNAEDKKHYIVEYKKEEVDGEDSTEYNFYMQSGDKYSEIPGARIRTFNARECM